MKIKTGVFLYFADATPFDANSYRMCVVFRFTCDSGINFTFLFVFSGIFLQSMDVLYFRPCVLGYSFSVGWIKIVVSLIMRVPFVKKIDWIVENIGFVSFSYDYYELNKIIYFHILIR